MSEENKYCKQCDNPYLKGMHTCKDYEVLPELVSKPVKVKFVSSEENKYYTPEIEEFKQGFKFELIDYRKGTKLGRIAYLFDEKYDKIHGKDILAEEDKWNEIVVFWDKEPGMITTDYNGMKMTYTEFPKWDWSPWIDEGHIENLIKNKDVRARK